MRPTSLPILMSRVPKDSAHGFRQIGSEFLKAARLIFEKEKFNSNFPGYVLVGQAIELYLKAYLRAKGLSIKELKSIGHNLKLAFETAERFGLSQFLKIEANDREALEKLSLIYQSKDFQYKNQGSWELPYPSWTIDFADRLSQQC